MDPWVLEVLTGVSFTLSVHSASLVPRFQEHGLALPLEVSWHRINDSLRLPYIKPSTFAAYLGSSGLISKLAGDLPLDELEDSLLHFWRNFSKQFPSHEVFGATGSSSIPLRRTFPCLIHGDEGRHYKKQGIMVVSMQGCIGKGSAPFHKKVFNIWSKKKTLGLNIGGHSFCSRLLLLAIPKRYYSQEPEVYLSMFDSIVSDFADVERSGFDHKGERWGLQILGLKGDLPYLTKSATLTRHYLRAARTENPKAPPAGMCFLCSAGQTGVPYEDFRENATWVTAPVLRPWETPPSFLKLRLIRDCPEDFLKPDVWHCFHGGMGMDFASSALVEMLDLVPGGSMKNKCKSMNTWLNNWIGQGNPRPHSGPFLPERVGLTSYQLCPDAGWSKFNDTRIYLKFIQDTLEGKLSEINGNNTFIRILAATQNINKAMSILFSSGLWLTGGEAKKAGSCGRFWILEYDALAKEAFEQGKQRFPLFQKIHMLDHIFRNLCELGDRLPYILNPASLSVQLDEEPRLRNPFVVVFSIFGVVFNLA